MYPCDECDETFEKKTQKDYHSRIKHQKSLKYTCKDGGETHKVFAVRFLKSTMYNVNTYLS